MLAIGRRAVGFSQMAIGDTLPVYGSSSGNPNVHRVRSKRMLYISAVCAVLMVSAVVALTSAARGSSTSLVTAPAHPAPAANGKVVHPAPAANGKAVPPVAMAKPQAADPDSINFEAAKKLADQYATRPHFCFLVHRLNNVHLGTSLKSRL